MTNTYSNIAVKHLSENCGLVNTRLQPGVYDLNSPAVSLMIDFKRIHAITVSDTMSVHEALEFMKTNRIRALMVVDFNEDFVGIITALDLMGRKSMVYANEAGIPRSEVQVRNVMIAKNKLKAIAKDDVDLAKVSDVVTVLKSLHDQHILVVEGEGDEMVIRGLFSASDFNRALGVKIDAAVFANTFSELERVIYEQKEVL